jgi:hypothetical protein
MLTDQSYDPMNPSPAPDQDQQRQRVMMALLQQQQKGKGGNQFSSALSGLMNGLMMSQMGQQRKPVFGPTYQDAGTPFVGGPMDTVA